MTSKIENDSLDNTRHSNVRPLRQSLSEGVLSLANKTRQVFTSRIGPDAFSQWDEPSRPPICEDRRQEGWTKSFTSSAIPSCDTPDELTLQDDEESLPIFPSLPRQNTLAKEKNPSPFSTETQPRVWQIRVLSKEEMPGHCIYDGIYDVLCAVGEQRRAPESIVAFPKRSQSAPLPGLNPDEPLYLIPAPPSIKNRPLPPIPGPLSPLGSNTVPPAPSPSSISPSSNLAQSGNPEEEAIYSTVNETAHRRSPLSWVSKLKFRRRQNSPPPTSPPHAGNWDRRNGSQPSLDRSRRAPSPIAEEDLT